MSFLTLRERTEKMGPEAMQSLTTSFYCHPSASYDPNRMAEVEVHCLENWGGCVFESIGAKLLLPAK